MIQSRKKQLELLAKHKLGDRRVWNVDPREMTIKMSAFLCAKVGCNACRPIGELECFECEGSFGWTVALNVGQDGRPVDPALK